MRVFLRCKDAPLYGIRVPHKEHYCKLTSNENVIVLLAGLLVNIISRSCKIKAGAWSYVCGTGTIVLDKIKPLDNSD